MIQVQPYSEWSLLLTVTEPAMRVAFSYIQYFNKRIAAYAHQYPMQVIPACNSLLIHCTNPGDFAVVEMLVHDCIQSFDALAVQSVFSDPVDIPVCYHPALDNDLMVLSELLQLDMQQIIRLHTDRIYQVYMNGFLPGFAYMGETDKRLEVPRKQEPVGVKAGAVAIAGRQTGIYPSASPGGWYVVGYTTERMFDIQRNPATRLLPGMQVRFVPISQGLYQQTMAYVHGGN